MSDAEPTTCWQLVHRAAAGHERDRAAFAARYLPLVRCYFEQRWRNWPIAQETPDAVQDVFVECCCADGPLARADPTRGRFRALLVGVTANVARRYEERAARRKERAPDETAFLQNQPAREARLSQLFDRQWAEEIMAQTAALMRRRACAPDAVERFEILRLRFQEGVPIREIAARWDRPARAVHDAYAKARREFYACLREIVAINGTASGPHLDEECRQLLALLG